MKKLFSVPSPRKLFSLATNNMNIWNFLLKHICLIFRIISCIQFDFFFLFLFACIFLLGYAAPRFDAKPSKNIFFIFYNVYLNEFIHILWTLLFRVGKVLKLEFFGSIFWNEPLKILRIHWFILLLFSIFWGLL